MRNIITLSIITFFLTCTTAYATPTITNYNNGVITCTGAGTKTTAAPQTWETYEDGTCDTTATIGTWESVSNIGINSDNNRYTASSYNAYENFQSSGTAGVIGLNSILSRKWFVSYWFKLTDWEWGEGGSTSGDGFMSNVKFVRVWNPDTGSYNENYYYQFQFGATDGSFFAVENIAGEGISYFSSPIKNDVSDGTWHNFQFEFLDSSTTDAEDAETRMWVDGTLVYTKTGFKTKEDFNVEKKLAHIGFYNAWYDNGPTGDNNFYMDDIYMDSTWARVEIGDNPDYDSCTHREVQIPSAWSDTEITITLNQGAIESNTKAYLFIVDSDGAVSDGYEITVGSISVATGINGTVNITGAVTITP